MAQEKVWNDEYRKSKLLTKENKPQSDVVRFVQFLKKEEGVVIASLKVLDLGSGIGRNSFYFAELGAKVTGLEISKIAIKIAEANISRTILDIKYVKQSIGEKFPLEDNSVDLVLDVTSSNSLTEEEREIYLSETNRVLKTGGYFFVKALCKDGDENAKYLVKNFPGKEKDTYVMPELGVTERVWSKEDFISTYSNYFKILHLEKKTSYSRMNGRSYKRNFWIGYLKK
ncbi:MAG: class I SAM-dependent methyltransferase [Candidatus Zambryskibacteria bacterium]|nr:class I SAM-dependent methyltransferase [Candidatus Zambryskibacteria bacterium]